MEYTKEFDQPVKNAFFCSSRGNEARISFEIIISLKPPYPGCYFINGL